MYLLPSHLRDTVTEKVRNPNICSIKCNPIHGEIANSESAEDLAIDCPDLTHTVARGICHPDVRTSNAIPFGRPPTAKSPRTVPSLTRTLLTVLLALLATQILAPSNAIANGLLPTVKVPRTFPLLDTLLTVVPGEFTVPLFAIPTSLPSKAKP